MISTWLAGRALDYYRNTSNEALGYALIFGFAVITAIAGVIVLSRQPEPPMPRRSRARPVELFSAPLRHPRFRALILTATGWSIATGIASPFFNAYGIQDLGLSSRGSGADNIRNVTGSPTAGIDPRELIDTRPYAREWHFHILNDRSLYGLPRKFNVAFDGAGMIPVLEDTNDIGFQAVQVKDGFGVAAEAFSAEVAAGSAQENATNQEPGARSNSINWIALRRTHSR